MLRGDDPVHEDLLDAALAPPEASDGLVAVALQAGDALEAARDGTGTLWLKAAAAGDVGAGRLLRLRLSWNSRRRQPISWVEGASWWNSARSYEQ
jgi:hypothetical protein